MRRYESGIGNQFVANLFVGGSNMVVNAINTATLGLPKTIGERIAGPMPENTPDPFNDPYGKKLGEYVGVGVGFMLPFKFLKGMKTPGVLSKLSPTVVRSMTAEAIYSTASEASDAFSDYREDGPQSLGDRASRVTVNTVAAGALDVGGTFIFNAVSKVVARASNKIKEAFNRPKVEAKPPSEVAEVKAVEGTGKPTVNRLFRTATQEDGELIDTIRKKYTAGKKRNVAFSKGQIGNDDIDLECVSGRVHPDNPQNKGNFTPPQKTTIKGR